MAAKKRVGMSSQKASTSASRPRRAPGAAGSSRQSYRARQDESLGARRGARKSLKNKVSKAGRRAMGSGPRKAAGGKKFGLTPRRAAR